MDLPDPDLYIVRRRFIASKIWIQLVTGSLAAGTLSWHLNNKIIHYKYIIRSIDPYNTINFITDLYSTDLF